ncbi:actin-related protein 2/3 complex subunit 1A-like [Pecten maximus]|uniref:actin-related protein 2/3 complex subunit 1A-like n=1 Tax=Pecten maximus TaxID=6579 RepID=UPI001458A17F|nr:actin-related protein 2/3 complex subunit 1A-like [Pecten maximus]
MPETFSFGIDPVTTHSWNNNHTEVAVSLNNHEVKVYKKTGITYNNTATLSEHGQRVTSIDWAPKSNNIVTCGADRNAYVWTLQDDGKWKPVLVILRINRAATCVRWSPDENKFAVGSGARIISICYFEEDNKWWVSKHIKKPIRSTVTCLDWHPNNILLAAGSTDFKARVFSGYIKDVEKKPSATSWGSKMNLGNLMCEFSNGGGGWVHSVSFSPSGEKLAWVGHDASVSVALAGNGDQIAVVKGNFLPFMSLTWVTENSMVCVVRTFLWSPAVSYQKTSLMAVMAHDTNIFYCVTYLNRLWWMKWPCLYFHLSSKVSVFAGTKADCTKFSTSGADGQLIIWDFKSLEKSISGLRIA